MLIRGGGGGNATASAAGGDGNMNKHPKQKQRKREIQASTQAGKLSLSAAAVKTQTTERQRERGKVSDCYCCSSSTAHRSKQTLREFESKASLAKKDSKCLAIVFVLITPPPHELITAADYCSITGSISQSYLFGVMQAGAAAFSEANVRRQ